MASIEKEVENALLNVVSGITGVNFFTSERGTARTMPSVTVQASISGEELVPFSGVFKTPASITYVARADTTARADFDAKFYDILEQLYRDPDLASYLTTNSNITFYVAKVTGDSPAVIGQNRTWSRAMTLDITATSKFLPAGLPGLSLWLKADAGVTTSGSNVTAWADQSANAYSLANNDQNSPNVTTIGGKTFIEFTKANNQGLSNSSIVISSPFTFFSVTKMKPTNGGRIFSSYASTVLIGSWSATNADGTAFSDRFFGGQEWLAEGTQQNTNVLLTTASVDADLNSVFKQNGGSETTFTASDSVTLQGISIGGGWSVNGVDPEIEQSNSFVAEFIIYNRVLTSPERQQVEAYLNTKYAIY
jgi:hypothetical protein